MNKFTTLLLATVAIVSCSDAPAPADRPRIPDAGAVLADAGDSTPTPVIDEAVDPGPGGFWFTISGEKLAWRGFAFPPEPGEDLVFVDGWEVRFESLLVTIGSITLADDPDLVPTDQSRTGQAVARLEGPWAFDLHKGGSLPGAGGSKERALPFASLREKNLVGGAFDPTLRYALSYDIVPANAKAKTFGFDETNKADYEEMIAKGWTTLYVGTATFRGDDCRTTDPSYDFGKLPKVVKFRLGFTAPAAQINCQNERLSPAKGLEGESFPRGVQIRTNASAIVQLTVHVDHAFWEALVEHAPAHFDPIAARAIGRDRVTIDDLVGVDFTSLRDAEGTPLPWRWCTTDYTPPGGKIRNFSAQGVPFDPSAPPDRALRDYRDFMTYIVSTQGHLNGHGLCFTERRYPSPR
jgi:hypothetical protein